MYFRPHGWAWQSRLLLRVVLSISPVLLSHSAWQIQCRFETAGLAAAGRDGCLRGQKATLDSRSPPVGLCSQLVGGLSSGASCWCSRRWAIDFPPMQKGASFNQEAVKEQIEKAMQSRAGR